MIVEAETTWARTLTKIDKDDDATKRKIYASESYKDAHASFLYLQNHVKPILEKVKNGESPDWLKKRLLAIGLKPISALVDITNYITFDLGRPLHVYDADKLNGNLSMRLATDGEKCKTLDEKEYILSSDMVVIADDVKLHGIGGIMGGLDSSCTMDTTNVFLEVALFDPICVTKTGRKINLQSDARFRFERGIDSTSIDWGVDKATEMILELCGGEASKITMAGNYEVPCLLYTSPSPRD